MTFIVNGNTLTLDYLVTIGEDENYSTSIVKGIFTWNDEELLGLDNVYTTITKTNTSENDLTLLKEELKVRFDRRFNDNLELYSSNSIPEGLISSDKNRVIYCSTNFKNII